MTLGNWQKLSSAISPGCLALENSLATWRQTNNVLSQPSLHLRPTRQLVGEKGKFSPSLHLGPSRQLVDEK